ncbi:sulfotransferase 2B1-like [Carettochelys insculpta]|uniref:sulfotransferase 2B1-like n=1 Tax=Carettochelys insculpta TaxID=44489 RepID=UPI003EBBAF26
MARVSLNHITKENVKALMLGGLSLAQPGPALACKYFSHKVVLFPCMNYSSEALNYLENEFHFHDDDVFNITYPKSGTHWMLEILSLLHRDRDPGWGRSVRNWDRAPWIDNHSGLKDALKYPSPRLLSSHLPAQLFPKSLQCSKAKIICTLRCPKDVLVSLYHFYKPLRTFELPESLDSFLEDFLSGNVPIGSWFDHVTGWMGLRDSENFFAITYKELQQDGQGSMREFCVTMASAP